MSQNVRLLIQSYHKKQKVAIFFATFMFKITIILNFKGKIRSVAAFLRYIKRESLFRSITANISFNISGMINGKTQTDSAEIYPTLPVPPI